MRTLDTRPSILLVDDDEVLRQVLSRVLRNEGYQVHAAATSAEALTVADQHPPQLALIDLSLGNGDGADLAEQLRRDHRDLPMILMTGHPARVAERPELKDQFERVLLKPLDLPELREAVKKFAPRGVEVPASEEPMPTQTPVAPVHSVHRPSTLGHASPVGAAPAAGASESRLFSALKTLGVLAVLGIVATAAAVFLFGIPLPWQSKSMPAENPPTPSPTKGVELVAGSPNTLMVPRDVQQGLGILQNGQERLYTAAEPKRTRALVMPGSTALDPTTLYRIRARFPARVVKIGETEDRDKNGRTVMRELRTGDRVKKNQQLAIFYSVDVGQKKNDLIDAICQMRLDERILALAEKSNNSVPEVMMLNFQRNVEGDQNTIDRAVNNLRAWDIPEKDIEAVEKEAEEIAKRRGRRDRSDKAKTDQWARVELVAPADGIIVERNVAEQELVADNTTNLFQIANLDRLAIFANVPEDDLPSLQALENDQRRWTVQTVGSEPIKGKIDDIGYIIDYNQHTAIVKGHIANPLSPLTGQPLLRAGQFITAAVDLPPPPDVVEIPIDAVVDDGQQCVVFVKDPEAKDHYTMRRVELVARFDTTAFVRTKPFGKSEQPTPEEQALGMLTKEPLRVGDVVILSGVGELKAALLDLQSDPNKKAKEGQ